MWGAFHQAKYFGNFGRKSNGKVRFGLVSRPEYLGPPLEVVHFDRSDRSDQNLLFHSLVVPGSVSPSLA